MNYNFSTQSAIDVVDHFQSSFSGLSISESKKRLQRYGLNEIKNTKKTPLKILLRQLQSPFIYILFIAALTAIVVGETIDGLLVIAFVFINTVLGFIQEYHSEKTISLLNKFVISNTKVLRSNKEILIKTSYLVPGDIVIINTGDVVPADLRLLESYNLMIDESTISGESAPVVKQMELQIDLPQSAIACHNMVFTGTTVVEGKGVGIVVATGNSSMIGEMAKLSTDTIRQSTFQKGMSQFSAFIIRMISLIIVLLFIANLLIKGPSTDLAQLVLFCVALAVGVIPEALPVVTTLSFSRGAMELARKKVVVRRLSAVEDLGSIQILCTDKTGTITENKLTVVNTKVLNYSNDYLFQSAALASSFIGEGKKEPNNSFDIAVWQKISSLQKKVVGKVKRIFELPFDPNRRRNSVLVQQDINNKLICRGASESILAKCVGINKKAKKEIYDWLMIEGSLGRRVIAVAEKDLKKKIISYSVEEESKLKLIGLISFVDPIKKSTHKAVQEAKNLNVEVKILTGDSADVAGVVAQDIGLINDSSEVMIGDNLMLLSDEEKIMAVKKYAVFARVTPEQKFFIISLLQKEFEVGFLGEGINDAPALKLANVALTVSGASDIAREASDIVLLNSSLLVIIDGINNGRKIFANTVKYLKITLISNFGNFYAVAIASLIITHLPMLPAQILLLNLLSDFPMIAIAMDTVEKSELRWPRSYNLKEVVAFAVILGLVSTIFDFIFFALFYKREPAILQTAWFVGSVITELMLVFSIRTKKIFWQANLPSFTLFILCIAAGVLAFMLPFTIFGQELLKFVALRWLDLALIGIVAIGYFIVSEIAKWLYYKKNNQNETVFPLKA